MARQLSKITQKENIHRRAHWIDKFLQNQEEKLPETEIIEWYNKPSVKRKTEEITYDILDSSGIPEDDISKLSEKILKLLNKDNL